MSRLKDRATTPTKKPIARPDELPNLGTVPPAFRDSGFSFGLEYPYIFGEMTVFAEVPRATGRWCVWHRVTGHVAPIINERNMHLAVYRASQKAHELNGLYPKAVHVVALDSVP